MAERSEVVEELAVRDASPTYSVEAGTASVEDVPPGYKRTDVGVIPEDWELEPLGNHVTITSCESPSQILFSDAGFPYFKVEQLGNSLKYLSKDFTPYHFSSGKTVPAGSVVFAKISHALGRDELGQPGVYVLTGPAEEGAPRLYVGEADVLRERLRQHVAGKDFWTRFVAFTSTNEGLNKAHVRYLESRLVELAKAANQWSLDNSTVPSPPPLSEPDRADADWFLQEMLVIFPLLGIDAFETAAGQARGTVGADSSQTLILDERGARATGREVGDGFVVLQGSRARTSEVASIHEYLRDLRCQLKEREVLKVEGDSLVFTQDFRFNSPSTAAGVLVGGNANGRLAWKDDRGRTLKAMQEERARESQ